MQTVDIETQAIATQELTAQEQEQLIQLESRIFNGFKAFFGDAGDALHQIKKNKLYRQQYSTWEDYCLERWGMTYAYADYLVEASIVLARLVDCPEIPTIVGILPTRESQCRPLAALPVDLQAQAWIESVQSAPSGKVTAKHIAEVAQAIGLEHNREKRYEEAKKTWTDFIVANDDPPNPTTDKVLDWAMEQKGMTRRIAEVLRDDIRDFVNQQPEAAQSDDDDDEGWENEDWDDEEEDSEQEEKSAAIGGRSDSVSFTPNPPLNNAALQLASVLATYDEQLLVEGLLQMGQEYLCGVLVRSLIVADIQVAVGLIEEEKAVAIANACYALGDAVDEKFAVVP